MRRLLLVTTVGTTAASLAVLGMWAGNVSPSKAQPPGADITHGKTHLTAAVDSIGVNPPGDRTPNVLMTFSHATQVSGDYSVGVDGSPITSGQAVAGFLLGCGISVAGGLGVGLSPNQAGDLGIQPSYTPPTISAVPPTTDDSAPTDTTTPTGTTTPTDTTPNVPQGASLSVTPPSFDLGPNASGQLGLSESVVATLSPGQVTTATTATATLDDKTAFPYHISFNNAALNVSQCASPVAAVPFITTTVSTPQGLVQTTAYGDQFTF